MVKKRVELLIMIPSILSATLLLSAVVRFCWKRKKILHIKKQGKTNETLFDNRNLTGSKYDFIIYTFRN